MSQSTNKKLAFSIICLFASMLLLSFAAAPLYSLFCKATGYGGTVQREQNFVKRVKGNKKIKVEFDANIDKELPWRFIPKHRSALITTGENILIFYEAENYSDQDIIGTAIYNVSPAKAGKYFVKVNCFCFEEQILKSGQKSLLPVTFYLDSSLEKDPEMQDIDSITLSYSFYKVRDIEKLK